MVALAVVQGFVQDTGKEETPRLDLWVRRWAHFLKGEEHCNFIHTENLHYCTTASSSTEIHLNNVNREQESEIIRASFNLIGYHAS